MTFFSTLRYLRHGPLQKFGPLWVLLGKIFRFVLAYSPLNFSAPHLIGPYGPFIMEGKFAFSDFASWGSGHNRGFVKCIEACRKAECVFDIGAHIGLVTMPMSSAVGGEGKVYAFEPSTANRRTLKHHMTLNNISNTIVINSLVGSQSQENVIFYESSSVSGMNTCAPIKNRSQYTKNHHKQVSLDDFCNIHGVQPNIIKIDVEGFELSVLEGARTLLTRSKPTIFLSVHPQHLISLGRSPEELKSLISEIGYMVSDMEKNPVNTFTLDEYLLTPKDQL